MAADAPASKPAPVPGKAAKAAGAAEPAERAEPKPSAASAKSTVPPAPKSAPEAAAGKAPSPEAVKATQSKPSVPPSPAAQAAAPPPAAPPPKPKPEPTGDAAMLRDAHSAGTAYDILEDGAGVLTVPADDLFTVAAEAKAMGYKLLSLLSAYDRADHFGVLYALLKPAATPAEFGELRLRVVLPKSAGAAGTPAEPSCPSLADLFPAADWQEREMYDMYGIKFEGHPDLRRIFLPDGWTGFPQRKDYKEPEQFVALRDGEDIVVRTNEEGSW